MNIEANQVVIHKAQIDNGPWRATYYDMFVDDDITENSKTIAWLLSPDLVDYLNRHFEGWRLLRRVDEIEHRMCKAVWYVLQVATDADAETLASRLQKDGHTFPYRKLS